LLQSSIKVAPTIYLFLRLICKCEPPTSCIYRRFGSFAVAQWRD